MIGRLKGTVLTKQPPLLIIDIHGVGYEVYAPMSTFYQLPELKQETVLLTHLVTREDAQLLYGFITEHERELFRALIKVNGVGPKLALTILSGMEPDAFVRCVQNGDIASLTRVPGVGKKTAERLVIEMRDALTKWQHANEQLTNDLPQANGSHKQDAISALTTLGYKANDAKKAIEKVFQPQLSAEEMIRVALQQMVAGV